ncbi:M28 family peptidase [Crateriforma spongiae]|uniref:M28 family peptidase n=1 Tax=Crateriforma spongiae TaxID=2724528 RepID=UPI001445F7A7|nr:M28 family peptidase [Crateriforma spongiae]
MKRRLHLFVTFATALLIAKASAEGPASVGNDEDAPLMGKTRQITFEGRRAGEGYFSPDASKMVFQSERDPKNPFYQIYWMDLGTGDIERVSPGIGKTTCAWIHPDGKQVLFASTHDDPEAQEKQQAELDFRASGKSRRYSWDYDPNFELYIWDSTNGKYTRLTHELGYDAEASFSPDGSQIVFASNRSAFQNELTDTQQQRFETDPSVMMELYIMDADGTNVRRLTDVPGYDGGPFFSPDGQRICWRRFGEDGATAEIYTMRTDGTDVQRLTDLGVMSWAPFYHPSGDYLVFTTNKHGFGNFELYLVRADGNGDPVRVTDADGFDGLPVFLPGGDRIAWTNNRASGNQSQIFMANWNDAEARRRLGLTKNKVSGDDEAFESDVATARQNINATSGEFQPADAGRHVDYLTRPELEGRLTGTIGEKKATAYVAAYLQHLGFEPAGEDGTFFQSFDFPAGSELTDENIMSAKQQDALRLGEDWTPLGFSGTGSFDVGDVVFAGYGMTVPGSDGVEEYDSYVHLDVNDKWVMILRDMPQNISADRRQQLARYSAPQRKASVARDRGAKGVIFVAGPNSKVKRDLIRFDSSASQAGVSIAVTSISNRIAASWFDRAGKDLNAAQTALDDGSMQMGYALEGVKVSAKIGIKRSTGTGRNVIARLATDSPDHAGAPVVVLGAHIDHLGRGGAGNSLATGDDEDQIHFGADDNASGVAAILEIAQYLASQKRSGKLDAKRELLIAAWSGEELGLFGSQAFVSAYADLYESPDTHDPHTDHAPAHAPHGEHAKSNTSTTVDVAHAHGAHADQDSLRDSIAVYLNLDMVGRLRESLIIQGIGSSPGFEAEVQRRNIPVGLTLKLDRTSTRLPTDASAFVTRNVPILSGFTGAHSDYHTPRDVASKLNYEGLSDIAQLFGLLTRGFLVSDAAPEFRLDEGEQTKEVPRARLTAYLGTIPDYASGDIKGVKLSGVGTDGPADKAGVQGGDIIVKLAGRTIENLYDYTYAIEALKIGETVEMVVQRGDEEITLQIVPGSRD